jgi:hypothetical protein
MFARQALYYFSHMPCTFAFLVYIIMTKATAIVLILFFFFSGTGA